MEMEKHRQRIILAGTILSLLIHARSNGEDIRLAWDPPIPPSNISSYALHVGTSSRQYETVTNVGLTTNALLLVEQAR